jgi:hypothetical protein
MNIKTKQVSKKLALLVALIASMIGILSAVPVTISAQREDPQQREIQQRINEQQRERAQGQENAENDNFFGAAKGGYQCGKGDNAVKTRINFGCLGDRAPGIKMSPVEDLIYAFVRFLSYGVGIVLIGSMILAGIQYSTSEGNPEATQAAKNRIRDAVIGLFIYLFAFAIVQYLVPGGLFK